MKPLEAIPVGDAGRLFVTSMLDGMPGLCSEMIQSVQQTGAAYGIVPEGTSVSQAQQFYTGHLITGQSRSQWLTRHVRNKTLEGKRGMILIQDLFCGPDDHNKHPPQTNSFLSLGQFYFWEEFGPKQLPDLQLLLDQPTIPDGLAAFLVEDPELSASLLAGQTSLGYAAELITEIYVPAYDDESFVMWRRSLPCAR